MQVALFQDGGVFGGMEVAILLLMNALDRKRYEPLVLVPGYTEPELSSPPEFVEAVKAAGIPILRPPHPGHQRGIRFLREAYDIWRILRTAKVNLLHVHTCDMIGAQRATLAAALAGIPVVRTEHLPPNSIPPLSYKVRIKVFDALTSRIVTVSETNRYDQIHMLKRNPRKLYRSYNGIDLRHFKPTQNTTEAKRQLGLDPSRTLVGNVGRLSEQKGQKYLIEAAAHVIQKHPNVDFVIVGSGPEEQNFREQIARLTLESRVNLVGYQPDPRTYIEAMDIATMPSLYEGFSISVLEFMAMGKPLIVSDHPSMCEAITDGVTGLIVRREDSIGLANAIHRLLEDPAHMATIGQAAAQYAQKEFSILRQADDMMSLYDSAMRMPRHR
jgi:glycosyltransferase involved in cell wall biosynthesis